MHPLYLNLLLFILSLSTAASNDTTALNTTATSTSPKSPLTRLEKRALAPGIRLPDYHRMCRRRFPPRYIRAVPHEDKFCDSPRSWSMYCAWRYHGGAQLEHYFPCKTEELCIEEDIPNHIDVGHIHNASNTPERRKTILCAINNEENWALLPSRFKDSRWWTDYWRGNRYWVPAGVIIAAGSVYIKGDVSDTVPSIELDSIEQYANNTQRTVVAAKKAWPKGEVPTYHDCSFTYEIPQEAQNVSFVPNVYVQKHAHPLWVGVGYHWSSFQK